MNEIEEIKYHNQLWYYKTYNQLIDKCIQMESEGYPEDMYTEVHHILPKCMGGKDRKDNLVRMPIRYHIIAHMLLASVFSNNKKIVIAVTAMFAPGKNNQNLHRLNQLSKFSSKLIAKFREDAAKSKVGFRHSEKSKQLMSEKAKISQIGRITTLETRRKMSESHIKRYNQLSSDEKRKIYTSKGNSKKVQDSKGSIYSSIKECASVYNVGEHTLSKWIKKHPEKGFKFVIIK